MGIYFDSKTAYTLYKRETKKPYFIDKSALIGELLPLVEEGGSYLCITRPRRFGKTMAANMIASFFSRACDASDIFDSLCIAREQTPSMLLHRNRYPVVHIPFNDMMYPCASYADYIWQIEEQLLLDLKAAYPQAGLEGVSSAAAALLKIYAADDSAQFLFVLDEWDFIFHQPFISEADKRAYLMYLRNLLKDRPYVLLAYMTGILPIAKYSSGSELNMFQEYTMASEERFSAYFGFTEEEVDLLFARHLSRNVIPAASAHIIQGSKFQGQANAVTREGLKGWYDGYHTKGGMLLYNPRSVVMALQNNNLGNYWTGSGPYDEIFHYIGQNVDAVRDDLALMVSGVPVPAKIREYAATSQNLSTKEEIFSAMVVYGFLNYENGKVSIPNQELMDKFVEMLQKEPSLGYVHRLAKESQRMLKATLAGDTNTMEEILTFVHNTEIPLLSYNHETELTAVVNLAYLAAWDFYRIEREDKAGTGYVDFIFYPLANRNADCLILELKVDHSPDEAIQQIKEKHYALRFQEKLGEERYYTGRILGIGIGYQKKGKRHRCKVEVLQLM